MSQNKTVIQGLEPAGSNPTRNPMDSNSNLYTRGNKSNSRGTIVPGMVDQSFNPVNDAPVAPQANPAQVKKPISGKPIVGFLYSVSKTPFGEYWPLQLGRNTIGKSAECDIVLGEGTVSSTHAVIITRQGKNGIIAAIKDSESTNGTMINNELIDFEAEECHNGDIITIGKNYQFLFILIDAAKQGLAPSPDFVAIDVEEDEEEEDDVDIPFDWQSNPTRHGGGFGPYDGNSTWGTKGNYQQNGGTVGLDGSVSGGNHGGTVSM